MHDISGNCYKGTLEGSIILENYQESLHRLLTDV